MNKYLPYSSVEILKIIFKGSKSSLIRNLRKVPLILCIVALSGFNIKSPSQPPNNSLWSLTKLVYEKSRERHITHLMYFIILVTRNPTFMRGSLEFVNFDNSCIIYCDLLRYVPLAELMVVHKPASRCTTKSPASYSLASGTMFSKQFGSTKIVP